MLVELPWIVIESHCASPPRHVAIADIGARLAETARAQPFSMRLAITRLRVVVVACDVVGGQSAGVSDALHQVCLQ